MNAQTLAELSEKDIAAHVQVCFSHPSGKVVLELLRTWCFMNPAQKPEPVESAEQATSRIGLVNLFRKIEYYRTQNPVVNKETDHE